MLIAKKKSNAPKFKKAYDEVMKEETKAVFAKVPLKDHKKLKMYLSKHDLKMNDWVVEKIRELHG